MRPVYEELKLVECARNGEFAVYENGEVWRLIERHHGKPVACTPRRAEAGGRAGYFLVKTVVDGHRYQAQAHRVVWTYFCGRIPEGLQINHMNGNKRDNRLCNLELVSASGNLRHAHAIGLVDQFGERNPHARLSAEQVQAIRELYSTHNVTFEDIADRFNISFQHASVIVRGEERPRDGGPISRNNPRGQPARCPITGMFIGGNKRSLTLVYPEVPNVR